MPASHLQATIDQIRSDKNIAEISRAMGVDEATARKAVDAALPTLIAGLGKNASTPEGARSLSIALEKSHNGSILDDVDGYIAAAASTAASTATNTAGSRAGGGVGGTNDGQRIVGHVLGDRAQNLEDGLGRGLGISGKQVGGLLAALAPLVLGALSKDQQESGGGAGGLTDLLLGPQSPILSMLGASSDSPAAALTGLLGGLMGAGTGSSGSADMGSLLGGMLGAGGSSGGSSGGDALGSLLGGLLGGGSGASGGSGGEPDLSTLLGGLMQGGGAAPGGSPSAAGPSTPQGTDLGSLMSSLMGGKR